MEIGDLAGDGFAGWESGVEDSVARFVSGCEAYDWEPKGALWWLNVTDEGLRRLRSEAF